MGKSDLDPLAAVLVGAASEIPGSQFASIDSSNHILLESEPGWQEFKNIFTRYVGNGGEAAPPESLNRALHDPCAHLSNREREILAAIAKGWSKQQIADSLFISETTVRNHVTNVFDKINVTTRARAIVFAKESAL